MTGALVPIDEVVHIPDITLHDPTTSGVSDADSTPTFSVYEEANDTSILGPTNFTKRTSLTGDYRASFIASAGNGFEAGKWYNVIASATVGGITGKKTVMHFRCGPAEGTAGVPKVDIDLGAMPDSVPATGVIPSLPQALYMLFLRHLFTTVPGTPDTTVAQAVKKVNGSTTAYTCTVSLDVDGNVISVVRAT